jgi:hypothetical protein
MGYILIFFVINGDLSRAYLGSNIISRTIYKSQSNWLHGLRGVLSSTTVVSNLVGGKNICHVSLLFVLSCVGGCLLRHYPLYIQGFHEMHKKDSWFGTDQRALSIKSEDQQ